jgi:hypothetical protein
MQEAYEALKDLQVEEKERVITWLLQKFEISRPTLEQNKDSVPNTVVAPIVPAGVTIGATAKVFMASKKPKTDVERITCLAYYLTHNNQHPKFKTQDLTKLNTDSAQLPFSNATVAVSNASRSGFISPAGAGAKQITSRGEDLVNALPDRAKAAEMLKETARARRKKPSKASKVTK